MPTKLAIISETPNFRAAFSVFSFVFANFPLKRFSSYEAISPINGQWYINMHNESSSGSHGDSGIHI